MVPNGWEVKNLEDLEGSDRPVVKAGPFGSSLKKEFYTKTGYKIYGQEQVIADDAFYGDYYIDEERYRSLRSCAVEPDDILISLVGTIGKVLLVPENAQPGVINPRLLRISLNKTQMSSKFFKYFLESRPTVNLLDRWAQGGTMGVLNAATLKALKVPVPPLPEQQKIAKILSTWDKAISTTERLIENSTQQKSALMQQLLTGKKRLLDESGKRFESEWEKYPVGDICQSIVPGRNKPKEFDGNIPWVTTPEFQGRYIPSKLQKNYISQSVIDECGAKLVPEGAVVIAAVGDLGLTAIASEIVVLNQQLHAFVCGENVHNEYLFYWLSYQKPYMESIASKTTIQYMNKKNCESIPVKLPTLEEQQKIATVLTNADKEIELLDQQLADLQQEKKALMQVLLTGKKRVVVD